MRAENSIRIFILKASVKITLGLTPQSGVRTDLTFGKNFRRLDTASEIGKQLYQLKLVCSPEMRCSNLNIWNYHVLQMQHLKLPGGANAPCEAEVCFENEV